MMNYGMPSIAAFRQKFFDQSDGKIKSADEVLGMQKNKEGMIKEAAALADSVEWNKTGEKFRAMMDQWKAAGSAGREHEDRLWNAFNESRQKFYDRRGEYYDQLHEQQDGKYEENAGW